MYNIIVFPKNKKSFTVKAKDKNQLNELVKKCKEYKNLFEVWTSSDVLLYSNLNKEV